jgi:flavin-binding protein dodecin
VIETIGTSLDGIYAPIPNALATTRGLDWFEVQSVHDHLENRATAHFQITIKVGSCTVEAGSKAVIAQHLKLIGYALEHARCHRHLHPALPRGQRPLHYISPQPIWSQPHNQIAIG